MKTVRSGSAQLSGLLLAALLAAPALQAQTTTMPSTLRYGSGLMDIPVATVLPHMAITGTFSGFFVKLDRTVQTRADGEATGFGPGIDRTYTDASVALGLFDRAEVGTTIQSLNNQADGGNMWGLFGRLALLRPKGQGLGLAVGGRYVTAPDYGNGTQYEPGRLGFPDARFYDTYAGKRDVNTKLTLYGVASAHVRGSSGDGFMPKNDITMSLGYGNGMFKDGRDLGFYNYVSSNGWFFGSAIHFQAGGNSILTVMGEYNGFDVNLGTQLDVNGIRLGVQYLAANYGKPAGGYYSEYRKPKFGFLGSVALCPNGGGLLCKPHLMERPKPDTVMMPAPPPDTVRVTREVERPLPDGTPAAVCLATGENAQVRVTAQGDTLVGPSRASIRSMRPGVVFAGVYAGDTDWYTGDKAITFEKKSYSKTGNEVRMDCAQIMRVGENMGVPLFAERSAARPFQTLYVPVRPGVWQAYQAGLRRTRG